MGRGGAQLGKSIKGKSKDKRKDRRNAGGGGRLLDVNGNEISVDGASEAGGGELQADLRALEEYERLAAASVLHRRRMHELAASERIYHAGNARTLHRLYRAWRRQERGDEMRWELSILSQQHTADIARKTACIADIAARIAQAQTQLSVAHRGHLLCLSRLYSLQASQLASLESDFSQSASSLRLDFDRQQSALSLQQSVAVKELELLMSAVEAEEAERVNEAKQAHETEREEIRNKNLEAINELRIGLESRIEEMERAFDEHHRFYREQTEAASAHFRQLKADDAVLSLQIFERKRKIARLHSLLSQWRQKLAGNEKDGQERNAALRLHKAHIAAQCQQLKQRMDRFRAAQQQRLSQLSRQAQQAAAASKRQVQQAERIIQLANMARHGETEKEKVLPLSAFSPTGAAAGGAASSSAVSLFLCKYNKVLLDVMAIEEEKRRLAADNAELRHRLQSYLDGLAITKRTIAQPNPLLIVNGRMRPAAASSASLQSTLASTALAATVSHRPPRLLQDGTQIVQQMAMHLHSRD